MPVVAINSSLVVGLWSLVLCRSLFGSSRDENENYKSATFFDALTCLSLVPILSFRGRALDASWSATFASHAGKPYCCHYRRQRVGISEILSTDRGTRSSGEDSILDRVCQRLSRPVRWA